MICNICQRRPAKKTLVLFNKLSGRRKITHICDVCKKNLGIKSSAAKKSSGWKINYFKGKA